MLKIDFHSVPGNADFEEFFIGHQCDQPPRILQELVQVLIAGDRVEVEEAQMADLCFFSKLHADQIERIT